MDVRTHVRTGAIRDRFVPKRALWGERTACHRSVSKVEQLGRTLLSLYFLYTEQSNIKKGRLNRGSGFNDSAASIGKSGDRVENGRPRVGLAHVRPN